MHLRHQRAVLGTLAPDQPGRHQATVRPAPSQVQVLAHMVASSRFGSVGMQADLQRSARREHQGHDLQAYGVSGQAQQ